MTSSLAKPCPQRPPALSNVAPEATLNASEPSQPPYSSGKPAEACSPCDAPECEPQQPKQESPTPEQLAATQQRWWHDTDEEPLDLLEVFCGEDRPDDLRDATQGAGGTAKGIDKCLAGAAHDISDDVVFGAVYQLVMSGRVRHLWLGVVCSSLSQLWLKAGRPRLRSRAQPDGITPMPPQWKGYISRANKLIERSETLAYAQWWVGNTYYIENPADVGFWPSLAILQMVEASSRVAMDHISYAPLGTAH